MLYILNVQAGENENGQAIDGLKPNPYAQSVFGFDVGQDMRGVNDLPPEFARFTPLYFLRRFPRSKVPSKVTVFYLGRVSSLLTKSYLATLPTWFFFEQ